MVPKFMPWAIFGLIYYSKDLGKKNSLNFLGTLLRNLAKMISPRRFIGFINFIIQQKIFVNYYENTKNEKYGSEEIK